MMMSQKWEDARPSLLILVKNCCRNILPLAGETKDITKKFFDAPKSHFLDLKSEGQGSKVMVFVLMSKSLVFPVANNRAEKSLHADALLKIWQVDLVC